MSKTIEQKYQKKTQKEHILDRPDSYIGDITPQNDNLWVYDKNEGKMVKKNINYVPGLIKIFDDQTSSLKKVSHNSSHLGRRESILSATSSITFVIWSRPWSR